MFSWISPKVKIGTSLIVPTQRGIIAEKPIAEGEVIVVMGGRIVDIPTHNKIGEFAEFYGMDFCEDFSFCPFNEGEVEQMPQFLINHSCRPNAGFRDQLRIVAITDIAPGDEICYDYAFLLYAHPENNHEFSIDCTCGNNECRSEITVMDWKIKELQEKYRDWFMPFLRDKFDSLKPR
jgi:hypothetical protein